MKTVLVTGGAGFIGSHIVDELIERTFKVIVFDNLVSGKKEFVNKKATFFLGDVSKKADLEKVLKKFEFDAIMHLAGQPSIINAFTDPVNDANTNFIGTLNTVLSALHYNIPRFIYASSMTVYGNPKKLPVSESDPCIPINYYGVAKYASELFVQISGQRIDLKNKFNSTSLRMFNVYGPRQSLSNPYQGVLAIFMGNVLRKEPITIYGDGKQARDFTYVKDVARIWVDSITNQKSQGQTINIGYGKATNIVELAKKVIKACGYDPKKYPFKYKGERPGDQRIIQADTKKSKQLLNFETRFTLQEGLNETLIWARQDNS